MDGISWEAVGVVTATIVAVGLALGGVLGCIWGKLSAIATKVDGLTEKYAENRDEDRVEHAKVWERLDDHESRITILEARE